MHGANRLASNSLLEGLVFGRRVAASIVRDAPPDVMPRPFTSEVRTAPHGELDLADIRSSLRSAMWRNVGIERAGPMLEDVLGMFAFWGRYGMDEVFDSPEGWEAQNLLTVGFLMTRAALARAESRGTHQRTDAPGTDAVQAHHLGWTIASEQPVRRPVAAEAARTACSAMPARTR